MCSIFITYMSQISTPYLPFDSSPWENLIFYYIFLNPKFFNLKAQNLINSSHCKYKHFSTRTIFYDSRYALSLKNFKGEILCATPPMSYTYKSAGIDLKKYVLLWNTSEDVIILNIGFLFTIEWNTTKLIE